MRIRFSDMRRSLITGMGKICDASAAVLQKPQARRAAFPFFVPPSSNTALSLSGVHRLGQEFVKPCRKHARGRRRKHWLSVRSCAPVAIRRQSPQRVPPGNLRPIKSGHPYIHQENVESVAPAFQRIHSQGERARSIGPRVTVAPIRCRCLVAISALMSLSSARRTEKPVAADSVPSSATGLAGRFEKASVRRASSEAVRTGFTSQRRNPAAIAGRTRGVRRAKTAQGFVPRRQRARRPRVSRRIFPEGAIHDHDVEGTVANRVSPRLVFALRARHMRAGFHKPFAEPRPSKGELATTSTCRPSSRALPCTLRRSFAPQRKIADKDRARRIRMFEPQFAAISSAIRREMARPRPVLHACAWPIHQPVRNP